MRSARHGRRTSAVEVSNISPNGLWLLLDERELFLPFEQFPWFRKAPIDALLNVQRPQKHHLWWPGLDVDLAVESIEHPGRYPLVSRTAPAVVRERSAPRRRTRAAQAVPKARAKPRRA
jgi:hypothetical protein